MSILKGNLQVVPQGLFIQSTTQGTDLGACAVTGDGREYRYVKAGASPLIVGQLQQGAAPQANLINVTAVAASAGDTSTTLVISTGTAIAANQLAGGYYVTYGTVGNGGGQIVQISSNTAVTSSGTSITLTFADALPVAVTTSATVHVLPSPYSAVIQAASTITGQPVGVAVGALAAGYYGWVQTKGIANVLIAGTPAVESGLIAPISGTAGALQVQSSTYQSIAINLITGVNGQYGPVDLCIN